MSALAIVFPCSLHVYATYHGVLSHKDHTLGAHGVTDLVHLLRRDIVDTDDEDAVVLLEERLQLVEVLRLGCRFATHSVLRYRNSLRLVLVLLVRVRGEEIHAGVAKPKLQLSASQQFRWVCLNLRYQASQALQAWH